MHVELVRGDYSLRSRHRNCVTAFGGFDGLHLGHQQIIRCALARAKVVGRPASVVLFEPLPREFFEPSRPPSRLYSLRERLNIIASLGIEKIVCLRFNRRIAAMHAEVFIQQILVDSLGVHTLLVGEGFRFGHRRLGNVALLRNFAKLHGFALECVDTVVDDSGERISSTRVRAALEQGDFALAARLLGRDYCISGRVGYGDRRARQLGFSTANLFTGRYLPPIRGVFAVAVEGAGGKRLRGVANAGYRPTFGGGGFRFEVHLPGFSGTLYGRRLRVFFLAKIRCEQRFDNLDQLKDRIRKDIKEAMEVPVPVSMPYSSR